MAEPFYMQQDGRISMHTFTESSDSAVDAWVAAVADMMESTPPDAPFLVLMDVSAREVTFTRYARQQSVDLLNRYRHRRGRFAFLFSSRIAPYFAGIFLAALGRLTFETQAFSSYDDALRWLREGDTPRAVVEIG